MTLIPRPYQLEAVQSIFDYYANGGKGNCLIALPMGLGKSLLPAMFIKQVMGMWSNQRFLMVTHNRKLIEQNYSQMLKLWSNAPIGVFSAGLKRKEHYFPIVYGGIGTMYKKAALFGHRDIIFCDEAHRISPKEDAMYQKFFGDMRAINPNVKIVGMTATGFRPNHGSIVDGKLFHATCYDGVSYEKFNKFIADGYMAPLVGKRTSVAVDTSQLRTGANGDFAQGQLEDAVNAVTREGIAEFIGLAHNRRSWLMFAGGIDNAEFMASELNRHGYPSAAVHSKLTTDEQDKRINAFKRGELRALTNYGMLTEGFDHPEIDAIGMFRATKSPNLHVQMGGRGTRIAPGKIDCLYADYGRNIERMGAINDPRLPVKKGKGNGEIPIKICEACGVYNHISARQCSECGEPFSFEVKITQTAKAHEPLRRDELPILEDFPVHSVVYSRHKGTMLKVSYTCGLRSFHEYVSIENPRAKKFVADWWRQRSAEEIPNRLDALWPYLDLLLKPVEIRVWVNRMVDGKIWPEIKMAKFGD